MSTIEVTKSLYIDEDKPVFKRLGNLTPSDQSLYLVLYKQTKHWEKDGKWRHFEARMRLDGKKFIVKCYLRITREMFGVKRLIKREEPIVIN
jgi:hypothetical protein